MPTCGINTYMSMYIIVVPHYDSPAIQTVSLICINVHVCGWVSAQKRHLYIHKFYTLVTVQCIISIKVETMFTLPRQSKPS